MRRNPPDIASSPGPATGLCLASLVCLVTVAGACAAEEPPRPNLLVLSIDTLRADHLGLYGYDKPTSPELDAFAARSLVFDAAIGPTGWTLPALASFMTSAYSSTHGCWFFTSSLDPSFPTLAEILRDAGWDTAAVASHVYQGMRHGLHQGFTHYDNELVRSEQEWKDAVNSPAVSDKGVRWIEQKGAAAGDTPWMLWLHYFDPHFKYIGHEEFSEGIGIGTDVENYDTEIAFTDHHIGRVFEALERTGQADNTVIVFFSDHGEEFRDHGKTGHSHTLYQELVRVPLVLHVPGTRPGRVSSVVRTIDVVPTLLDVLGVAPAGALQGQSLAPLLAGETLGDLPAVSELRVNWNMPMDSLVRGKWKLIAHRSTEEGEPQLELYDLEADPEEQRDLAAAEPDLARELLAALDAELAGARAASEAFDVSTGDVGLSPTEIRQLSDLGYLEDH